MSKLYLIRHAQSANNAIWNGNDHGEKRSPDPELTTLGHRQAKALASHIAHPESEPRQHPYISSSQRGYSLTHLYCSLMTRSILTAQYVAKECALPLEAGENYFEKEGIYELSAQGDLIGLPGPDNEYFSNRFPDLQLPKSFNPAGWWNRPAESDTHFLQRMKKVVEEFKLMLRDRSLCIGLVAHGDFIDQFINELMGIERHDQNYNSDWVANWTFHNTSITRIDFLNGSHNVVYTNRIDHLSHELISW